MKKYTFTLEETQEIKAARKKNRDKNVEKRLAALEMRAEGKQNKEIREKTGFHTQYSNGTFRNVPLLLSHACLCAGWFDAYEQNETGRMT